MSGNGSENERLERLEGEVSSALRRLQTIEERVNRLVHTVDQLRTDYAEEPDTLEKA